MRLTRSGLAISDNICHLDARTLEEINTIVVVHGREGLKKSGGQVSGPYESQSRESFR